jgi:hypothetical protein
VLGDIAGVAARSRATASGRRYVDARRLADHDHHRPGFDHTHRMVRRLVGPTRRRIATAADKTLAAMQAIVASFNANGESLSLAPNRHAPIFEKMDDGPVLAAPWCMGFLAAMQLRWKDWAAVRDLARLRADCCSLSCSTARMRMATPCLGCRATDRKAKRSSARLITRFHPLLSRSEDSRCHGALWNQSVLTEPLASRSLTPSMRATFVPVLMHAFFGYHVSLEDRCRPATSCPSFAQSADRGKNRVQRTQRLC